MVTYYELARKVGKVNEPFKKIKYNEGKHFMC